MVYISMIIAATLVVGGFFYYYSYYNQQTKNAENNREQIKIDERFNKKDNLIKVTEPMPDQIISSPLVVAGEARGSWYFEASFPVKLLDGNGSELARVPAQAQGDWMTNDFVPFKAVLNFGAPATATGTLVLEKDNPSGLPQNADELRIPVRLTKTK